MSNETSPAAPTEAADTTLGKAGPILWIMACACVVVGILQGSYAIPFFTEYGPSALVGASIVFTFIHCAKRYGVKTFLVFLALAFVIGNIYENTSIATGFPFGPYHYTDSLGPKFIFTPWIINIAYFQMLYLTWTMVNTLIGHYDNRLQGKWIFIQALFSMFVMVMWDLLIDPYMSTVSNHWQWHDGGSYFGVPMSNYLGWCLCTFTMFLCWALWTSRAGAARPTPAWTLSKANQLMICTAYFAWPLAYILMCVFVDPSLTCTAYNGQVWNVSEIITGCTTVGLCGMVFVTAFVLVKHLLCDEGSRGMKEIGKIPPR